MFSFNHSIKTQNNIPSIFSIALMVGNFLQKKIIKNIRGFTYAACGREGG